MEKVRDFKDKMFTAYGLLYPKETHHYFKSPGVFVRALLTKIVTRDGRKLDMDTLIEVDPDYETIFEKMLINREHQSHTVGIPKMYIIADYRDYSKCTYGLNVLSEIAINEDPKNSPVMFEVTKSDILNPRYIYFD